VFAWSRSAYAADVFELLPGMVAPMIVYAGAEALARLRARS
jgi:hypothetical protein